MEWLEQRLRRSGRFKDFINLSIKIFKKFRVIYLNKAYYFLKKEYNILIDIEQ